MTVLLRTGRSPGLRWGARARARPARGHRRHDHRADRAERLWARQPCSTSITGYERPDAGQVYLAGRPITDATAAAGLRPGHRPDLPADPDLPRLTRAWRTCWSQRGTRQAGGAWEPAGPDGCAADRERAMELLDFTGLAGHAGALARSLSYGQRKLLELAYVLVADPAIVLLDEPPCGMNPSLINLISDRITDLNAAGKDVPGRRAQHGLRDGPVRPGHRARLRRR